MAVLAMDTATQLLAAAVGPDDAADDWLGCASLHSPRAHSRWLQPTLQSLLQSTQVRMQDLTAIGVGVGPGSYTGVRIAVSTAKAMATALRIPLVPIPTLLALAEAARTYRLAPGDTLTVLPLLYARRARAFGALYEWRNAAWQTVLPAAVRPVHDWLTAAGEEAGRREGVRPIVIHDFKDSLDVMDLLRAERAGPGTVVRLADIAASFGPALWRLTAAGGRTAIEGDDIHAVAPEYVLPVEAETRLAEGSVAARGHA